MHVGILQQKKYAVCVTWAPACQCIILNSINLDRTIFSVFTNFTNANLSLTLSTDLEEICKDNTFCAKEHRAKVSA